MKHKIGEQWTVSVNGVTQMLRQEETNVARSIGTVNKEGCLPEERTGKFPSVNLIADENSEIWFVSYKGNGICVITNGESRQEAIDRWNRRKI